MSVSADLQSEILDITADLEIVLRGEDGKSAYEVAVDNGFVGTEQEWLDSLKGEADRAEAYTQEARESRNAAQSNAILAGNQANAARLIRDETQAIRDGFAPEVANAMAAIRAEKEEAEQKKLLVDEAAENAHLDRVQADADAEEVRYLLGRTIEEKNVATDAAERARIYSETAVTSSTAAAASEANCAQMWEEFQQFPQNAEQYAIQAGAQAQAAAASATEAEGYKEDVEGLKLEIVGYRNETSTLCTQTGVYASQADASATAAAGSATAAAGSATAAAGSATAAAGSATQAEAAVTRAVSEAVTAAQTAVQSQLDGKLNVGGKAVDSAHADNADTVNNHTVLSDVPANAVFTDTTYEQMTDQELDTGTSTTGRVVAAHTIATFVLNVIADVINSAPAALDTLEELAAAINDDPDFHVTVMNEIGKKLDKTGGIVTGDLAVNGTITGNLTGDVTGNAATATNLDVKSLGSDYEMNPTDFASNTIFKVTSFKADATNSPSYKWTGNDVGDYWLRKHYFGSANFCVIECISPRWDCVAYGKFWDGVWQGWEIPALSAANAATATKATGDKNGNDIAATYLPLAGGTMTGDLTIEKSNPGATFKDTRSAKGTPPAGTQYTNFLLVKDKNDVKYGGFEHCYRNNGESTISMYAYPGTNNTTSPSAEIKIGFDSNGNRFTSAPTPVNNADNSTKIATTAWVRTATGETSLNAATASKAAQLTTAHTIDGVSFNGTGNITHYGVCSTAAATVEKTVDCPGFVLATGARIIIKFTVTNTAASPTLNVNGTGAKPVYYRNAAINAGYLAENNTYEYVYNGTQYELIGNVDSNNATAQNISTANATYPILLGNKADATANIGIKAALFGSGVKVNPSTSEVIATKFTGALDGNASTATKQKSVAATDGSYSEVVNVSDGTKRVGTIRVTNGNGYNAMLLGVHNESNGAPNGLTVKSTDGSITALLPGTFTADSFVGPLTGNVTGNCSGSSGSCTGNAATATKINGKTIPVVSSFDSTTGTLALTSLS